MWLNAHRTGLRITIAILRATEQRSQNEKDEFEDAEVAAVEHDEWHCCLNTFCFCVSLVLMNLFCLQWLYYKL
jgi:hypothetical protein